MNFTKEEKKQIFKLFRRFNVEEVSQIMGIRVDKLIPLKTEYDSTVGPLDKEFKEVSIALMNNISLEVLEYYRNKYPNNAKIQSLLLTKCAKIGAYDLMHKIWNKYPNHIVFDSQRVKIMMRMGHFKEAIEICNKYPDSVDFQRKLKRIYSIVSKYNISLVSQLNEEENLEISQDEDSVSEFAEMLEKIREKLKNNTFSNEDLLLIKDLEGKIDGTTYKFILVATYHRRRMIKSALQVLKTIDDPEYKKLKNRILTLLNNKKMIDFYDMGLYDEIIGWGSITQNTTEKAVVNVKKRKIVDED